MGIMNFTKNGNKRIRLDYEHNLEGNAVNDDLWGPEDITADEFDMLEFQATQSMPTTSVSNVLPVQVASTKQKQYELEGKIKILSDTIETAKKELAEEKLKRDKIVSEKTREYEEKEKLMQKQVEKLQSSLQFKDQEMKAIYEKVKSLEIQLKVNNAIAKASTNKSPNKYLEKFDFKDSKAKASTSKSPNKYLEKFDFKPNALDRSTKANVQNRRKNRKFRLPIDAPKDQTQCCDIVSSRLCNRLFLPPSHTTLHNQTIDENFASVSKLSLQQRSNEIFQHCSFILENYVSYLESSVESSNYFLPAKMKELNYKRTVAISCLKDLSSIISSSQYSDCISSLQMESFVQEVKKVSHIKDSSGGSVSSNSDRNLGEHEGTSRSLLSLLFILSKPDIYPNGFSCKEEVEWSLLALVSWSATNPKSVVASFNDTVITSHMSNCFSITSTSIALKLLINICPLKEYIARSLHTNDTCHLCSIATLLNQTISNTPLECMDLILMVEDFLNSVFSVHITSDLKLESTPCSMMVLQAFLAALLKFYSIHKEGNNCTLLLKKGFTLLHYLFKHIPDLKSRRGDFEDLYVSTVCAMLTLSKEDPSFKDFRETAHELWDFQEDTSEFVLSEDPVPAFNLKGQNDR